MKKAKKRKAKRLRSSYATIRDLTTFTTPIPAHVLAHRREATDYLLALAAGAPAICRTTHVLADWKQAIEEDTWRDWYLKLAKL